MGEARHGTGPAKRLIQKVMQGKGRQPFLAADDLGNLHQMVVHYVCEMVRGKFVGPFP